MYRLVFFAFLLFFLAACTKVVQVPAPITELDPVEDPIFSTLDFATPQDDRGYGLAINGNNLYVVGQTTGNLDGTNQGGWDGILRRYNGLKLWGVQFGTKSFDEPIKVATDSSGNVYVVGYTGGPLGFQVGSIDVFLAKFNKDGELLWGEQFGTKIADLAIDLAIDSNNRIYVLSSEGNKDFVIRKFSSTGQLLKTKSVTLNNRPFLTPIAMAVDGLNNLIILTHWDNSGNSKGTDIRLFKYGSSLNLVWEKAYSTVNDDVAYDITTDSNNNIYFTLNIAVANKGAYFVKKNSAGNTRYSRRLEYSTTSSDTIPTSITNDSADNIYIAGYTPGSFSGFTNAGSTDIVVFKYNSAGSKKWLSQFGLNNYGSANFDVAFDIVVSSSVYITGYTSGNLLTGSATSYGGTDAYVSELKKQNGNIVGVDQ